MASLVIPPASVAEVEFTSLSKRTLPGDSTVTARGQCVRVDGTTGKWTLASGATAAEAGNLRYVTVDSNRINQWTAMRDCVIDVGDDTLDAGDFDDPVYLSDTDGELTLVALESTETVIVGYIVPQQSGDSRNRNLQVL